MLLPNKNPIYTDKIDDMVLRVYYENDKYTVNVYDINDKDGTELTEIVDCLHVPVFGIDVADMMAICETAEKMAVQIETKK